MYYIIEDVWKKIKDFLFHNIKTQGKHLKNDIHIKHFNLVITKLPKLYVPGNGPRIIHINWIKGFKILRFLYHLKHESWERSKTIIETVHFNYYFCVNQNLNNEIINDNYYTNHNLTHMCSKKYLNY
tara:strand:- start:394 stop:774 length:381 start_codon:yes stop_codon:yes gene_type:complete